MSHLACFTIITPDYVPFALTVLSSFRTAMPNTDLFVIVTDQIERDERLLLENENIKVIHEFEFQSSLANEIRAKYGRTDTDCFRWSLKPIGLNYFLENQDYEKAVFVDPDLYFYNSIEFINDLLNNNSVVLSPHFRSTDPSVDNFNFELNFMDGLYNGGFIGGNQHAINTFHWWAKSCLYYCSRKRNNGLYVDQKYLDLIPIINDSVHILKHKGCNVANWNQWECRRTLSSDGHVTINQQYPIIFIHFTQSTILGILSGTDNLLESYLKIYSSQLNAFGLNYDIIESGKTKLKVQMAREQESVLEKIKTKFKNIFKYESTH